MLSGNSNVRNVFRRVAAPAHARPLAARAPPARRPTRRPPLPEPAPAPTTGPPLRRRRRGPETAAPNQPRDTPLDSRDPLRRPPPPHRGQSSWNGPGRSLQDGAGRISGLVSRRWLRHEAERGAPRSLTLPVNSKRSCHARERSLTIDHRGSTVVGPVRAELAAGDDSFASLCGRPRTGLPQLAASRPTDTGHR
jgi:hypothetical protein